MKELLWIIPFFFLIAWKPLTIRDSNDTSAINQNFDRLNYEKSNYVTKSGTQTITGYKTFDDISVDGITVTTVTVSSCTMTNVTVTGQAILSGTDTNDNAASGYVGEYKSSTTATAGPLTSGQYTNHVSIALTPGDWDVSACTTLVVDGGSMSVVYYGLGTAAGNDSTGMVFGVNSVYLTWASASSGGCISPWRVSISGNTTYYLKVFSTFTGTVTASGIISARRVR